MRSPWALSALITCRFDDCVSLALPLMLGSAATTVPSGVDEQLPVKKKKDAAPPVPDNVPEDSVLQLTSSRRKKADKEKEKEKEKEDAVMTEASEAAKDKESEREREKEPEKEREAAKEGTMDEKEREARDKLFELLGEDLTFSLTWKVHTPRACTTAHTANRVCAHLSTSSDIRKRSPYFSASHRYDRLSVASHVRRNTAALGSPS